MYYAKRAGGNTYRYFSAKMTEVAARRLTLENNLRKAIERNELELHYQPQFNLKTGNLSGLEALLRWNSAELGSVPPSEFISLAEETGLILSIGEWILRKACLQTILWQQQGLSVPRIAVNVSVIEVIQKNFCHLVDTVLTQIGLAPNVLVLELTESALATDEGAILGILASLKEIGVLLAIDDFGTGYSSLSRLRTYPIDYLKIDQTFINEIEQDQDNSAIVTAVIGMAEGLEMSIIAEGIETSAQLEFLKNKGCNEVQGYLLSKPLPLVQIEAFLRTQLK